MSLLTTLDLRFLRVIKLFLKAIKSFPRTILFAFILLSAQILVISGSRIVYRLLYFETFDFSFSNLSVLTLISIFLSTFLIIPILQFSIPFIGDKKEAFNLKKTLKHVKLKKLIYVLLIQGGFMFLIDILFRLANLLTLELHFEIDLYFYIIFISILFWSLFFIVLSSFKAIKRQNDGNFTSFKESKLKRYGAWIYGIYLILFYTLYILLIIFFGSKLVDGSKIFSFLICFSIYYFHLYFSSSLIVSLFPKQKKIRNFSNHNVLDESLIQ